jgi:hypothetical protein
MFIAIWTYNFTVAGQEKNEHCVAIQGGNFWIERCRDEKLI